MNPSSGPAPMRQTSSGESWIGLFDLFRVGIGPSSSHTVGPMRAARRFREELEAALPKLGPVDQLRVELQGSLGATGIGHGTDRAVVLGLLGQSPESIDPDAVDELHARVLREGCVPLSDGSRPRCDPAEDIALRPEVSRPFHPNAMTIRALKDGQVVLERDYYSIGGGFLVEGREVDQVRAQPGTIAAAAALPLDSSRSVPYPYTTADELLARGRESGMTIAQMQWANERVWRSEAEIEEGIDGLWRAMQDCVQRGLSVRGSLPGSLKVARRAQNLHQRLLSRMATNDGDPLLGMDWVNLYALAVNEENAAGGRVVTAPTNGAAGIVPAVLHYFVHFIPNAGREGIITFFLVAAAIGSLIKRNASISGAEVGCQGEVGSACAMAAAGLAAALGASNDEVENAAEIALEHNLGLTCDPVAGLVQIPCIERNAIAAVKAINAARLAIHGDGEHRVSLDQVIGTLRDTGRDMSVKYKETSLGGLAVSVIEC